MLKYLYPFPSMCHKSKFLLAFLLSLATLVSAQILVPFNGIVTDLSGHPIKKVKVYNYDPKRFTFTDSQGRFGLTNVRVADTLHLVYKKVQYDIPVDGKRSMRIRFSRSAATGFRGRGPGRPWHAFRQAS